MGPDILTTVISIFILSSIIFSEREENAGTFCSPLCPGSLCFCPRYWRACRSMSFTKSISQFLHRRDRSLRSPLCTYRLSWLRCQIHRIPPSGGLLRTRYRTCPRFVDSELSQWQRLRRLPPREPASSL